MIVRLYRLWEATVVMIGETGTKQRDAFLYLVVSEILTGIKQCLRFMASLMKLSLFWREHPSFPLHEILTKWPYIQLIGHRWVLDGHAEFRTNAEYHQYYLVIARTWAKRQKWIEVWAKQAHKQCYNRVGYFFLLGQVCIPFVTLINKGTNAGANLGGGCRGCAAPPEMTCGLLIQLVFCKKKQNCVIYWCLSRARDECTPS